MVHLAGGTDAGGHSFSYDPVEDVFTFAGHKISGELLRQLAVSRPGVRFRILERKDGVITVGTERSALEAAAPALLAHSKEVMALLEERGGRIVPHLVDTDQNPGQRLRDAIAAAEAP